MRQEACCRLTMAFLTHLSPTGPPLLLVAVFQITIPGWRPAPLLPFPESNELAGRITGPSLDRPPRQTLCCYRLDP